MDVELRVPREIPEGGRGEGGSKEGALYCHVYTVELF